MAAQNGIHCRRYIKVDQWQKKVPVTQYPWRSGSYQSVRSFHKLVLIFYYSTNKVAEVYNYLHMQFVYVYKINNYNNYYGKYSHMQYS